MRKKLIIAGRVLVLAVAGIWGGSVIYATVETSRASGEFTLSPQTPGNGTPGAGAPASLEPGELSGTWKVAAGSQAGYRVDEVLNGQNATVVGRTSQVTGEAAIAGTRLTAAGIVVDMNSLVTDSDSRDRQFQSILKTLDFPTSTFTLTEPVEVGALAGGTSSVSAVGELSIAGVTRAVTASLKAQTVAAGVQVQGSIPVVFSDFGIDAPNFGFVKVEGSGSVEMLLRLDR